MKLNLQINSVDFDANVMDDLFLTFLDADTSSEIGITIPYHVAKKLVNKLNNIIDNDLDNKLVNLELENADLKSELEEIKEVNEHIRERKIV